MALYKLVFKTSVRKKDLKKTASQDVRRIVKKIEKLRTNPYPIDAVKLKGRDEWRIRQGDYRILYQVNENIITVIIVRVGHRRNAYR